MLYDKNYLSFNSVIYNTIDISEEEAVRVSGLKSDVLLSIVNDARSIADSNRRKSLYGRFLTTNEYVPIKTRQLTKIVDGNTVINNDPSLINKKINLPLDNIIISTAVGYLLGEAVTTNVEESFYDDDKVFNTASDLVRNYIIRSSWDDVNSTMATYANTCGYGVKILSNMGERIYSTAVNPWQVIFFGSYTEPEAAVRIFMIQKLINDKIEDVKIMEYYDDVSITYYEISEGGDVKWTNQLSHSFGFCPCIGFPINSQIMGRAEKVLTMIDSLDELVSDFSSEITASRYAQMLVSGYDEPEDSNDASRQKAAFLNNRLLLANADSKVQWISRDIDATIFKEMYDKLETNIYSLSATPNMTDENFNTSSGVALSYKMQAFSQDMATQQRKFIRGFRREFEMIANFYNELGYFIDPLSVSFKFNLKEPKNIKEQSEIFGNYYGKIPIREALKVAGFTDIENIARTIEASEVKVVEKDDETI